MAQEKGVQCPAVREFEEAVCLPKTTPKKEDKTTRRRSTPNTRLSNKLEDEGSTPLVRDYGHGNGTRA